jgi:hypothetical protein
LLLAVPSLALQCLHERLRCAGKRYTHNARPYHLYNSAVRILLGSNVLNCRRGSRVRRQWLSGNGWVRRHIRRGLNRAAVLSGGRYFLNERVFLFPVLAKKYPPDNNDYKYCQTYKPRF